MDLEDFSSQTNKSHYLKGQTRLVGQLDTSSGAIRHVYFAN